MHPTLARGGRLALHLAVWTLFGVLLSAIVAGQSALSAALSLAVALPLTITYGFICLSAWYVVRTMPLPATALTRVATTAATAALTSAILWTALARVWLALVSRQGTAFDAAAVFADTDRLYFGFGLVLYLFSIAVEYAAVNVEQSRAAERRGFEGRVAAREAELRSLRAQIDPHFLFNSLHSISALNGADPAGARRMCLLLAEFLRESLALGAEDWITLERELGLARRYLEIEQIRFGDRLRIAIDGGDGRGWPVPPLLLQPLVENAVTHGIAHVLDGGTIRIAASVSPVAATITIQNPCDPERPKGRGVGVGLANVRARLQALYGEDARLSVVEADGACRAEVVLPAARPAAGEVQA